MSNIRYELQCNNPNHIQSQVQFVHFLADLLAELSSKRLLTVSGQRAERLSVTTEPATLKFLSLGEEVAMMERTEDAMSARAGNCCVCCFHQCRMGRESLTTSCW